MDGDSAETVSFSDDTVKSSSFLAPALLASQKLKVTVKVSAAKLDGKAKGRAKRSDSDTFREEESPAAGDQKSFARPKVDAAERDVDITPKKRLSPKTDNAEAVSSPHISKKVPKASNTKRLRIDKKHPHRVAKRISVANEAFANAVKDDEIGQGAATAVRGTVQAATAAGDSLKFGVWGWRTSYRIIKGSINGVKSLVTLIRSKGLLGTVATVARSGAKMLLRAGVSSLAGLLAGALLLSIALFTVISFLSQIFALGTDMSFGTSENIVDELYDYCTTKDADLTVEIRRQLNTSGYDEVRFNCNGSRISASNNFEIHTDIDKLLIYLQATNADETHTVSDLKAQIDQIYSAMYRWNTTGATETVTETTIAHAGDSLGTVVTSAYCPCSICCGRWAGGPTASGVMPQAQHTLAVDAYNPIVPIGTEIIMDGVLYKVEDTGDLNRHGVNFDVFHDAHQDALNWGHKSLTAYIAGDEGTEVTVTVTHSKSILNVNLTTYSMYQWMNYRYYGSDDTSGANIAIAALAMAYKTADEAHYDDGTPLYRACRDLTYRPKEQKGLYQSCDRVAGTIVRWSGADDMFPVWVGGAIEEYCRSERGREYWMELPDGWTRDDLLPGDVISYKNGGHVEIYVGHDLVQQMYPDITDPDRCIVEGQYHGHRSAFVGSWIRADNNSNVFRSIKHEENSEFANAVPNFNDTLNSNSTYSFLYSYLTGGDAGETSSLSTDIQERIDIINAFGPYAGYSLGGNPFGNGHWTINERFGSYAAGTDVAKRNYVTVFTTNGREIYSPLFGSLSWSDSAATITSISSTGRSQSVTITGLSASVPSGTVNTGQMIGTAASDSITITYVMDGNYVNPAIYLANEPSSSGGGELVETALTQLNQRGGQPYWTWYGFDSRVAWCACFVSWCADQCDLISAGTIPKYSACSDGAAWFQSHGQWAGRGYAPSPGDIVFFVNAGDTVSHHTGIVMSCDESTVQTIEGNSGDAVRIRSYDINSTYILGYGLPTYS